MNFFKRDDATTQVPSPKDNRVAGERDEPSVKQVASVQSRASRILALGLMSSLGLGLLIWYYLGTIDRQSRAQDAVKAAVAGKARSEMELPTLGRIDPPSLAEEAPASVNDAPSDAPLSSPPQYDTELSPTPGMYGAANGTLPPYYGTPVEKTPAQLALERRLSGAAFSRSSEVTSEAVTTTASISNNVDLPDHNGPPDTTLSMLLKPTVSPAARAQVLPTQRFLLPKGSFIDCTLETAIDSTLPGMTTCITATDTFGVDGKVILLERGTKLIGETRGQVRQGFSRVFVLWTEARTPTGVVVPLDSPGADELGRSGLAGRTERHFWDRFGAAILISMIDGTVQSIAQSGNGAGTVIYSPSSSRDLVTEVLKDTVNIAPTVVKPQGDRIQILVARDLDFRSAYELRSTAH